MERTAYKYRLLLGGKVIAYGVTYDLARRAAEHRQQGWLGGRVEQVGQRTTWGEAQRWHDRQKLSV